MTQRHALVPGLRTLAVDAYRLALCALLGAVTGVIAIVFRAAVGFMQVEFTKSARLLHYADHPDLSELSIVLSPALGGLIVGLLVYDAIIARSASELRVHTGPASDTMRLMFRRPSNLTGD